MNDTDERDQKKNMTKRFTSQTAASPSPIAEINSRYLADEQSLVTTLAELADPGDSARAKVRDTASGLVAAVRRNKAKEGGLDAFLQQYDLSSEEGVLLMCIAEALLRIPDADTADRLIALDQGGLQPIFRAA